jgi:DNA-binding LytR/AlgR family response regulator
LAIGPIRSPVQIPEKSQKNHRTLIGVEFYSVRYRPKPALSKASRHIRDGAKMAIHRVLIKCDGKVFLVKEQEIVFVEAAGNYVYVGLGSVTLLTRTSLTRLETILNMERFVRVHRSAIVNLDQIGHLEPQTGGEYLVTLRGGKQLKASRRHVGRLMRSIRRHASEDLNAESLVASA